MRAILRDTAAGLGWAALAILATVLLYYAGAFHGWEGAILGAAGAAGAAYWFHRKPRVSALAAAWFVLAVAGAVAWFLLVFEIRGFRTPGL